MIGEPLEAWHNALAKMPVVLVSFTWSDKRRCPSEIVLDIPRAKLSAAIASRLERRRTRHAPPPLRVVLNNFGHGLGGRLFSVGYRDERFQGAMRHLFTTGNLHNLTIAISSHVPT